MNAPSRITAGYDADAALSHVFPDADERKVSAGDPAAFAAALAVALSALCGTQVAVTPLAAEAAPLDWQAGEDGSRLGLAGGAVLAAALLSRQCGGVFEGGAAPSAQVERSRIRLLADLRNALPRCSGSVGPQAFAVSAGSVHDRIDAALVAAPPPPPDRDRWHGRLRAALDGLAVPVRLVLHEGPLAVRAARSLAVGDVLPLATAHEVGVRVGALTLAQGHVVDAETGAPRVMIVARGQRTLKEARQ